MTEADLIESAPDGMVLIDAAGRIAYVNRQFEAMTGSVRQDLLGHRLSSVITEIRDQSRRTPVGLLGAIAAPGPLGLEDGEVGAEEGLLRRADEMLLPVETTLTTVMVGRTEMTLVSVRDVSSQRSSDRRRQQLLGLLDLEPDAVFVTDAVSGAIEYANRGAALLLGYSSQELCSMTTFEIIASPSLDRRHAIIDEHRRMGPRHHHEIHVIRRGRDGTDIPVDSRNQMVVSADGREKFIIVDRDARPRLAAENQERRRSRLRDLVVRATTHVASGGRSGSLYQLIADGTAELLEAENATLILRRGDGGYAVAAHCGDVAGFFASNPHLLNMDHVTQWSATQEVQAFPAAPDGIADEVAPRVGPVMATRFPGPVSATGLVAAIRSAGRDPFSPLDGELLAELACQIASVVELSQARADQARLTLLEDRQRIARDLHDTVIQDVFAVSLQLSGLQEDIADPVLKAQHEPLLDQLDRIIRRLRTVVFEAGESPLDDTVAKSIQQTIAEAARTLGHEPSLRMEGPVDEIPAEIVSHMMAVLREALSNVARHADATNTEVSIIADETTVEMTVTDDGRGMAETSRPGTGTANFRSRASLVGGTCRLEAGPGDTGTRLVWTAMLSRRRIV